MKRILAVILAAMMLLACAACGENDTPDTDTAVLTGVNEALDILNTVWATYGDEEKFFAMGGDYVNNVMDAPGKCDVSSSDNYAGLLVFPADNADMIDDAASLIHAMNANTFTGAVYHVADAANTAVLTEAIKTNIMNNQWMCGFPEKLLIATLGDSYIVTAFGAADIVDNFQQKLVSCYDITTIVCDEPIA